MSRVAVIGGGASGMVAAIFAREAGAEVTLFEKKDRLGQKILATGNGRCNISNLHLYEADHALSYYHGTGTSLLPHVFDQFGLAETEDFFASLGIFIRTDPNHPESDRLYPYNLQASSVQDALRWKLSACGVRILTDADIRQIRPLKTGFKIEEENFDTVILSCGGLAGIGKQVNHTSAGYSIARDLRIPVTELSPSLVKLRVEMPYGKRLSGVRMQAGLHAETSAGETADTLDEILFAEDGISGTAAFAMSALAGRALEKHETVTLAMDLFPDWTRYELADRLEQLTRQVGDKPLQEMLNGLLHKKLIPVALLETGVDQTKPGKGLTREERWTLVHFLKGWQMPVTGTAGFAAAQVTAGGIPASALTDQLEVKAYPGLYVTGEMVDLDGDCGGYNLQWAWSSGAVAGRSAAMKIVERNHT